MLSNKSVCVWQHSLRSLAQLLCSANLNNYLRIVIKKKNISNRFQFSYGSNSKQIKNSKSNVFTVRIKNSFLRSSDRKLKYHLKNRLRHGEISFIRLPSSGHARSRPHPAPPTRRHIHQRCSK